MKHENYFNVGDYVDVHNIFPENFTPTGDTWDAGIVLYNNKEGGTLKIYSNESQRTRWVVTTDCEIISESR